MSGADFVRRRKNYPIRTVDLPPGQKSGLIEAVRILSGVDGVARVVFGDADVVRHDLVRRIVAAYDAAVRADEARGR